MLATTQANSECTVSLFCYFLMCWGSFPMGLDYDIAARCTESFTVLVHVCVTPCGV